MEQAPLRGLSMGRFTLEDLAFDARSQTQMRRQPYRFPSQPSRTIAARMVPIVGFLLANQLDALVPRHHLGAGRSPRQRRTIALKDRPFLSHADAPIRQGDEGPAFE